MDQLENGMDDFQSLHANHFGKCQRSGSCSKMFQAICPLWEDIRPYENMKMQSISLNENRHAVFNKEYRWAFRRSGSCIYGVQRLEEMSILGNVINNDGYYDGNYLQYQKEKGHGALFNSNNGEAVLISDFKKLSKHVKNELIITMTKLQNKKNGFKGQRC